MAACRVVPYGREMSVAGVLASCAMLLFTLGGCEAMGMDGADAATSVALLSTQVAGEGFDAGDIEELIDDGALATLSAELFPTVEASATATLTVTPATAPQATATPTPPQAGEAASFALVSPAFGEGGTIPTIYTCDGQDISPALRWRDAPEGTESVALICDDPDAPGGSWVHWIIYDVPVSAGSLPEAVPSTPHLAGGGRQGRNSWARIGYGGPCPPSGVHRYVFRLFALDTFLGLTPEEVNQQVLLDAISDHVLGEAVLIGTYQR